MGDHRLEDNSGVASWRNDFEGVMDEIIYLGSLIGY